jgi:hypothetical protein
VLMMEVLNIGGVLSYYYHDLPFDNARQAMCEEA